MKKKVSLHVYGTEHGQELIAMIGVTDGGIWEREDVDAVVDLVSIHLNPLALVSLLAMPAVAQIAPRL